jgi:hypothetical protein
MADALKLRARDAEDLETIAAVLQDALVPRAGMKYQPGERRFALMVNRFCWEGRTAEDAAALAPAGRGGADARFADQDAAAFERVRAALVFDRVRSVKHRGLAAAAKAGVLSLLTLRLHRNFVLLSFAGGAEIRLEVDRVSCHLEDLGEPWPTVWRPRHSDSEIPGGPR